MGGCLSGRLWHECWSAGGNEAVRTAEFLGTGWYLFPWAPQVQLPSHQPGGQDLQLAKAAAPTFTGWHSAGPGFLTGVGRAIKQSWACLPEAVWQAGSGARALCSRAISLSGHLGAAHRSKNSPSKPEMMAFWAQGSWFSCPTCFRTDRFCVTQEKSVIALGAGLGLPLSHTLLREAQFLSAPESSHPNTTFSGCS